MYVCMYVCMCVCVRVLFTLPLEWSGRNKVLFTLPVKQCYFPPPKVCGNLLLDLMCVGGRVVYKWLCAGVHACVCVSSRVCGFTYRQKDDLVHKLRYDGIKKVYHIIYLSFRISLFLPIYIRTPHIHTFVCVCVCVFLFGCSHIRRRKEFYLSKALTH